MNNISNRAYDTWKTTDYDYENSSSCLDSGWIKCDRCGYVFNYEDEEMDCCPKCFYKMEYLI